MADLTLAELGPTLAELLETDRVYRDAVANDEAHQDDGQHERARESLWQAEAELARVTSLFILANREWLALVEWERAVRSVAGVPHETPIRTVDGQFAGITPHRDPLLKKLVVIVGANWKPEAGR